MATPLQTLRELDKRLRKRRQLTDLFERYYAGNHRLAYATEKYRDAFGDLFGAFADNWCGVIADTPNERLEVEGFMLGDSPDAANAAWDVWDDNDMKEQASVAQLGAIKCGVSYVLVDTTGSKPMIAAWPSSMAIVKNDKKTRKAIAGMTTWTNDDGTVGAEVYLPDKITRYRSADVPKEGSGDVTPERRKWIVEDQYPNPNEDGALPLVELVNRPNELRIGKSDLSDVIALQDAINKLANDMLIASEFQAFRQRVLTGVEIPKDPETGRPLASQQIEAAMSRLWAFEPTDAKVYDLETVELGNYVAAIKELLNHLAAQTRTPPHYLIGQMVNVSGEALAAAESGLVSRVRGKQLSFGRSWKEVIRLALGTTEKITVVWKNPERQSLAAIADAVVKLAAPELGLERRVLWAMLGFSPLEIEKMQESEIAKSTAVDGKPKPTPTPPADVPPPAE